MSGSGIAAVARQSGSVNIVAVFVRADFGGQIWQKEGTIAPDGSVVWTGGRTSWNQVDPTGVSGVWARPTAVAITLPATITGSAPEQNFVALFSSLIQMNAAPATVTFSSTPPPPPGLSFRPFARIFSVVGGTLKPLNTWTQLPGLFLAPLCIVPRPLSTTVDMFGIGLKNDVFQLSWDITKPISGTWKSLGGSMLDIAGARSPDGRLHLLGRATDGTIRYFEWSSDPLTEFELDISRLSAAQQLDFQTFLMLQKAASGPPIAAWTTWCYGASGQYLGPPPCPPPG